MDSFDGFGRVGQRPTTMCAAVGDIDRFRFSRTDDDPQHGIAQRRLAGRPDDGRTGALGTVETNYDPPTGPEALRSDRGRTSEFHVFTVLDRLSDR